MGAAATLAMLGTGAPAQAERLTHVTTPLHFEGEVNPWFECDGFDLILNYGADVRLTEYFNADGDLVRARAIGRGTGTFYNSVTLEANTGSSPSIYFDDFVAGTNTIVGRRHHNNLPGQGNVALDAGRIVFDMETGEVLFSAGPHPGEENIDWCSIVD
ncbi:MAG TPA: hypothetical protein VF635_02000 [Propionibacteriaceae bacterium]